MNPALLEIFRGMMVPKRTVNPFDRGLDPTLQQRLNTTDPTLAHQFSSGMAVFGGRDEAEHWRKRGVSGAAWR